MRCAVDMMQRLGRMNERLVEELRSPIQMGIGIHTGLAIVGTMGPPKTPILSAVGDTVNTTARLEGMSKELGKPIVVSVQTLDAAGFPTDIVVQHVQVRGRSEEIAVATFEADELAAMLPTSQPQDRRKQMAPAAS